jgi:hypothetical protein
MEVYLIVGICLALPAADSISLNVMIPGIVTSVSNRSRLKLI